MADKEREQVEALAEKLGLHPDDVKRAPVRELKRFIASRQDPQRRPEVRDVFSAEELYERAPTRPDVKDDHVSPIMELPNIDVTHLSTKKDGIARIHADCKQVMKDARKIMGDIEAAIETLQTCDDYFDKDDVEEYQRMVDDNYSKLCEMEHWFVKTSNTLVRIIQLRLEAVHKVRYIQPSGMIASKTDKLKLLNDSVSAKAKLITSYVQKLSVAGKDGKRN